MERTPLDRNTVRSLQIENIIFCSEIAAEKEFVAFQIHQSWEKEMRAATFVREKKKLRGEQRQDLSSTLSVGIKPLWRTPFNMGRSGREGHKNLIWRKVNRRENGGAHGNETE